MRDTVRRQAVAAHLKLSGIPVHAQWDSFSVFLIVFVIGLGIVAYFVKLARTSQSETGRAWYQSLR